MIINKIAILDGLLSGALLLLFAGQIVSYHGATIGERVLPLSWFGLGPAESRNFIPEDWNVTVYEFTHDRIREGVLILSGNISNQAERARILPYMSLRFNDMYGNPIAQGYFTPYEYIADTPPRDLILEGQTPMNIELQITDPGGGARGYEVELIAYNKENAYLMKH